MLRKLALAGGVAVLCAGVAVGAQQPTADPQPTTQQPTTQEPATQPETTTQREAQEDRSASQQTTTIEGCVYHEKDIPGRTPNVAERAGVMEDYILVASTGTSGTPGATGTTGAATAAAPKMYKLEHKPDEQLSAMVGKRVQVTGRIDAERGDATGTTGQAQQDQSAGPDRINLPEFEVTSIRETQGECPARPESR